MLPCIRRAQAAGIAVMVLAPNCRRVAVEVRGLYDPPRSHSRRRVPIPAFSSPEAHLVYVWDKVIAASQCRHVCIWAFGTATVAVRELVEQRLSEVRPRLRAMAFTDAQHRVRTEENHHVLQLLYSRAVNFRCHPSPPGELLMVCLW